MVIGHVFAVNPANPVRGPKDIACGVAGPHRGAGPRLLERIDTSTAVGMQIEDHYPRGACAVGAAAEKGGKRHRMPGAPELEAFINEYFAAAGVRNDDIGLLFRPVIGKAAVITEKPMNRVDAYRIIRRRTAEAGLKVKLGCHVATSSARPTSPPTYRPTGLETQAMAAHEGPPTAKLYDRTGDEIERITI